jgi:UDP:flavonoid glycosyltransferase YjiC (YdhE family)
MIVDDPRAATGVAIQAAQLAGCRMIIQRGWTGLGERALPETIHVTDYAPHDWLFSRASCVIHHGGAGTSAAMFCAGVPGIFVPYILDMPFWAACAERLGCAGPPIPPASLTPQNLADRIATTLGNPGYPRRAKELGAKLRKQHGVRTARLLIEDVLAHFC